MSKDSRDSPLNDSSFQEALLAALKRKVVSSSRRDQSSSSAIANSPRRELSSSSDKSRSQQTQRKRKQEESYEDLLHSYCELTSSKRCEKFASKKKKNEVSAKGDEELFGISLHYYKHRHC